MDVGSGPLGDLGSRHALEAPLWGTSPSAENPASAPSDGVSVRREASGELDFFGSGGTHVNVQADVGHDDDDPYSSLIMSRAGQSSFMIFLPP